MISVPFQGKPFNIRVIQINEPATKAEKPVVEPFYEDLQDFLELTHTHTKNSFSSQVTGMQKWEVKRALEQQASLTLKETDKKVGRRHLT